MESLLHKRLLKLFLLEEMVLLKQLVKALRKQSTQMHKLQDKPLLLFVDQGNPVQQQRLWHRL